MGINVLEPRIYNHIAAGEVVERPASVVKELVENSIDAKATRIEVEITAGGTKSIKVTDNGCGIEYRDLEKAFLPHATSKISSVNDLDGIQTLGFRGEALSSIGAVAEVKLYSKTKTSDKAGFIEISGGNMGQVTIASVADGTTIEVDNLFFNVPARAKFLKKTKTEESEITNLIERFIIANPCVSIKYIIDGKMIYLSTGKGIKDALYTVYGKSIDGQLLEVDSNFTGMKIYGYIGKPSFTKPNKTYQTLIVNNRYIINGTIASAIHNAYGEMLMKRQFPFYALYMDIDFTLVDVNVHPNKMDVRFDSSVNMYIKFYEAVNRVLNTTNFVNNIIASENGGTIKSTYKPPETKQVNINSIKQAEKRNVVFLNDRSEESQLETEIINCVTNDKEVKNVNYNTTSDKIVDYSVRIEREETTVEDLNAKRKLFDSLAILNSDDNKLADGVALGSKLLAELNDKSSTIDANRNEQCTVKVLGTIFNTYIIIEYKREIMFLIDQHAGHERLLYDRYLKQMEQSKITKQSLLIPYILKLNSLEFDFISNNIQTLLNMGFELEEFGNKSFKITAVPTLFTNIRLDSFFASMLEDIKNLKQTKAIDFIKDRIATCACKSAVKGGDNLSELEINTLLAEFESNNMQMLCPHGRPVVVKVDRKEIEKWFKRIV